MWGERLNWFRIYLATTIKKLCFNFQNLQSFYGHIRKTKQFLTFSEKETLVKKKKLSTRRTGLLCQPSEGICKMSLVCPGLLAPNFLSLVQPTTLPLYLMSKKVKINLWKLYRRLLSKLLKIGQEKLNFIWEMTRLNLFLDFTVISGSQN